MTPTKQYTRKDLIIFFKMSTPNNRRGKALLILSDLALYLSYWRPGLTPKEWGFKCDSCSSASYSTIAPLWLYCFNHSSFPTLVSFGYILYRYINSPLVKR